MGGMGWRQSHGSGAVLACDVRDDMKWPKHLCSWTVAAEAPFWQGRELRVCFSGALPTLERGRMKEHP